MITNGLFPSNHSALMATINETAVNVCQSDTGQPQEQNPVEKVVQYVEQHNHLGVGLGHGLSPAVQWMFGTEPGFRSGLEHAHKKLRDGLHYFKVAFQIFFTPERFKENSLLQVYSQVPFDPERLRELLQSTALTRQMYAQLFQRALETENKSAAKQIFEAFAASFPEDTELEYRSLIMQKSHLLIRALLDYKISPDHFSADSNSPADDFPLAFAVRMRKFAVMVTLLNYGAEVNQQNSMGNTAFHTASRTSQYFIAAVLLHYNADPLIANVFGESPLTLAFNSETLTRTILNFIYSIPEKHIPKLIERMEDEITLLDSGGYPAAEVSVRANNLGLTLRKLIPLGLPYSDSRTRDFANRYFLTKLKEIINAKAATCTFSDPAPGRTLTRRVVDDNRQGCIESGLEGIDIE